MKDQLYFDGSCPLCAKEIAMLKKYADKEIEFIDIHIMGHETTGSKLNKKELVDIPTKESLLKVLHLRQATGSWLTGLDANVHIWSNTRYGKLLAILRWPLIRQVADAAYNLWARKRYEKRYDCGTCKVGN